MCRDIGLNDATDTAIWKHAPERENGFVIVSKDSDFHQRRFCLIGHPPKFIWLRVGNCPVDTIQNILPKAVRSRLELLSRAQRNPILMLPVNIRLGFRFFRIDLFLGNVRTFAPHESISGIGL